MATVMQRLRKHRINASISTSRGAVCGVSEVEALGAGDVDTIHARLPQRLKVRKREFGKPYIVGLALI